MTDTKPELAPHIEPWRASFRTIAARLSRPALEALRNGLRAYDVDILQGATTSPPALDVMAECEVEAACPVAYAVWKGDGLKTIGEVTRAFDAACATATDMDAEARFFLDWCDMSPRRTLFKELLSEVERILSGDCPVKTKSA